MKKGSLLYSYIVPFLENCQQHFAQNKSTSVSADFLSMPFTTLYILYIPWTSLKYQQESKRFIESKKRTNRDGIAWKIISLYVVTFGHTEFNGESLHPLDLYLRCNELIKIKVKKEWVSIKKEYWIIFSTRVRSS